MSDLDWSDSIVALCRMCGDRMRDAERLGGRSECFPCRYGDPNPTLRAYPMDLDLYATDDAPPPQEVRDLVNEAACRGFCVECKAPMNRAERLASLACKECVEKLGSDEQTGRWDGKAEPSEDEKKGAA